MMKYHSYWVKKIIKALALSENNKINYKCYQKTYKP